MQIYIYTNYVNTKTNTTVRPRGRPTFVSK